MEEWDKHMEAPLRPPENPRRLEPSMKKSLKVEAPLILFQGEQTCMGHCIRHKAWKSCD